MRGVRRKTAQHLRQAWNTIPHVTQQDRADITELEQLRAKFAPRAEEAGGKMTVTAIALKVCASALKVFPQFNASIDMAKEEIIYKQYISIGVAVDTDRGLLVPVIRDVAQSLGAALVVYDWADDAAAHALTRSSRHRRRLARWEDEMAAAAEPTAPAAASAKTPQRARAPINATTAISSSGQSR